MKLYAMYFDPSGETKKVLDVLAEQMGGAESVDFTAMDKRYDVYRCQRGDVCLIGVPAKNGRVPAEALGNLMKVKADHAAAILVVTYGQNGYGDALLELRKSMESCGFISVAAAAVMIGKDSQGNDHPDADDRAQLQEMALKMKEKATWPRKWKDFFVPGRYPYRDGQAEEGQRDGRNKKSLLASIFGKKKAEPESKTCELFL